MYICIYLPTALLFLFIYGGMALILEQSRVRVEYTYIVCCCTRYSNYLLLFYYLLYDTYVLYSLVDRCAVYSTYYLRHTPHATHGYAIL